MNTHPPLTDKNILVWQIHHAAALPHLPTYEQTLSRDERNRFTRFRFRIDRESFILSHGALRALLARYLSTDSTAITPKQIKFTYPEQGKPQLRASTLPSSITLKKRLRFNLSHSQHITLVAFTLDTPIGVDVEYLQPLPEMEGVIVDHFSHLEGQFLSEVPRAMQLPLFFKIWCRKEALLKGLGTGFSSPLDQFTVISDPTLEPSSIITSHPSDPQTTWTVADIELPPHYAAALAYQGKGKLIQLHNLHPG